MKNLNVWLAGFAVVSAIGGSSSFAQSEDCLINQPLPSFENLTGYELITARDGTQFTAQEKTVFNQVATVLPDFYRHMNTLQTFERVPDGFVLDNGGVGEYTARGWSVGRNARIRGSIFLAQNPIATDLGRFTGEFYFNIVHEMSHAFDQLHDLYSESVEWSGLSKWDEDGNGTSKNFVTWYAPTSASEDFAESMTYFILNPDQLLKTAPDKFEVISKRFFNGKRFDSKTLIAQYSAELSVLPPPARLERIRQIRKMDYYACRLLPLDGANY